MNFVYCLNGAYHYSVHLWRYMYTQSINIEKELWLCTGIEPKICKRIKSYAT